MKREIKFRAFCGRDKMMYVNIQNGIAFEDGSIYDFNEFINPPEWDYHEWHIMQYTGLKDRLGKEIYEGDICQRYHVTGPVVYHAERGMFILNDGFNEPLYREIYGVEVIGNIYENPELLNQTI